MLEKPLITLTTDFGLKDPFVGIMKGAILSINPKIKIVDLSHNITPYNIREASQVIFISHKYFPLKTIHVVVVDPGVGGIRNPLLIVTEDHYFIGPDNGVFTSIIEKNKYSTLFKVIKMSSSHFYRENISPTFHGRDIFAPAAAWLSKGVDISKFGEETRDYTTFVVPEIEPQGANAFDGTVIHIDSFGNAITNITRTELDKLRGEASEESLKIVFKDKRLSLSSYYSETNGSGLSALINSFESLELFTFKRNVSELFDIKIGDKVSVILE